MRNLLFGLLILFSCLAVVSAQSVEAKKLSEFGNENCEVYMARIDAFLTQFDNNPSANGYVFVYTGKLKKAVFDEESESLRDKFSLPRKNDAKEVIISFKRYIAFRGFEPKNFVFIEAGFREKFTIEFWVVPNGAVPPKASPTVEKVKYRKGKAINNCEGL